MKASHTLEFTHSFSGKSGATLEHDQYGLKDERFTVGEMRLIELCRLLGKSFENSHANGNFKFRLNDKQLEKARKFLAENNLQK